MFSVSHLSSGSIDGAKGSKGQEIFYILFVFFSLVADCLPPEMKRLLRWRLSPITPLVVKSALVRAGFRITKSE